MPEKYDYPNFYKLQTKFIKSETNHLHVQKSKLFSIQFSNDSKRIASTSADNIIKINTLTPEKEVALQGHTEAIYKLMWDTDHQEKLCSVSLDKTIRFWDLRAAKQAYQVLNTEDENLNADWSPDGTTIAVADSADNITFIDPRGGSGKNAYIVGSLKHDEFVFSLAWDWRGDLFYRTMGDGTVHVLKYPTLEVLHIFKAHSSSCLSISMDPKGKYLATGGGDAIAAIWDLETYLCASTCSGLESSVKACSFSVDGEVLATASLDEPKIEFSFVETGDCIYSIKTKNNPTAICFSPSKPLFAYSCDDTGRDRGTISVVSW